ncbi:MAG: hypothetical protein ACI89J_004707 [Hyphomicrobiaceae bacterium]|jgi:hypothetical protein
MAGSEDFYRALTPATSFSQVAELQYYDAVPDDWTVLIGDIRGSTEAIRAGNYKSVNMVGAAVITAVLNACPGYDIPFVFGGDGGTLIVPPAANQAGREALARLRVHAQSLFGLDLRAGAVTVAALRAGGHDLRVMKLRLSEDNHLAMFSGGGLAFADEWLKRALPGDAIHIPASEEDELPDLEGMSCRWQPLASQNGMILALISASADTTAAGERAHFYDVTQALTQILGAPLELSAPVSDQTLKFRWPPAGLELESRATAGHKSRVRRKIEILSQSFIQGLLELFNGSAGYYDARKYREEMRHNTDFEKYDGMLRLVLDVTIEQAAQIDAYLHGEYQAGRLYYGIHSAQEALMTCVVFSLQESRHVHFIDGANGGFALAAAALKAQLASTRPATHTAYD